MLGRFANFFRSAAKPARITRTAQQFYGSAQAPLRTTAPTQSLGQHADRYVDKRKPLDFIETSRIDPKYSKYSPKFYNRLKGLIQDTENEDISYSRNLAYQFAMFAIGEHPFMRRTLDRPSQIFNTYWKFFKHGTLESMLKPLAFSKEFQHYTYPQDGDINLLAYSPALYMNDLRLTMRRDSTLRPSSQISLEAKQQVIQTHCDFNKKQALNLLAANLRIVYQHPDVDIKDFDEFLEDYLKPCFDDINQDDLLDDLKVKTLEFFKEDLENENVEDAIKKAFKIAKNQFKIADDKLEILSELAALVDNVNKDDKARARYEVAYAKLRIAEASSWIARVAMVTICGGEIAASLTKDVAEQFATRIMANQILTSILGFTYNRTTNLFTAGNNRNSAAIYVDYTQSEEISNEESYDASELTSFFQEIDKIEASDNFNKFVYPIALDTESHDYAKILIRIAVAFTAVSSYIALNGDLSKNDKDSLVKNLIRTLSPFSGSHIGMRNEIKQMFINCKNNMQKIADEYDLSLKKFFDEFANRINNISVTDANEVVTNKQHETQIKNLGSLLKDLPNISDEQANEYFHFIENAMKGVPLGMQLGITPEGHSQKNGRA